MSHFYFDPCLCILTRALLGIETYSVPLPSYRKLFGCPKVCIRVTFNRYIRHSAWMPAGLFSFPVQEGGRLGAQVGSANRLTLVCICNLGAYHESLTCPQNHIRVFTVASHRWNKLKLAFRISSGLGERRPLSVTHCAGPAPVTTSGIQICIAG